VVWTKRRSRRRSRIRNGMKTIKASRSQRPPSLEPALSQEHLQEALAATRLSAGTGFYQLLAGTLALNGGYLLLLLGVLGHWVLDRVKQNRAGADVAPLLAYGKR
jgi:hypothetical protein